MENILVDFIPKISTTGDFKKISDYSLFTANNRVSTLLNYLEMVSGRNSIFPNFGGYQELISIPYSENPDAAVSALSSSISVNLTFSVNVDYKLDEKKEIMNITLTVDGLPQSIMMDAERSKDRIRFVNPRLI